MRHRDRRLRQSSASAARRSWSKIAVVCEPAYFFVTVRSARSRGDRPGRAAPAARSWRVRRCSRSGWASEAASLRDAAHVEDGSTLVIRPRRNRRSREVDVVTERAQQFGGLLHRPGGSARPAAAPASGGAPARRRCAACRAIRWRRRRTAAREAAAHWARGRRPAAASRNSAVSSTVRVTAPSTDSPCQSPRAARRAAPGRAGA